MDDGTLELATRLTPDVIRVTGRFPGDAGEGYYVDLAQGIYMLVYQDIFDGTPDPRSRATYSFPQAAAEMPAPAPGSVATLEVVGLDGGDFFSETMTHRFGAAYMLDIGGCSYDAIDVEYFHDGDTSEMETFTLLPDLSFSFLVSFEDAVGRQEYRPVRIYVP